MDNLNKHISGQFNAELEHIRTQAMTMGWSSSIFLTLSPPCTIRTANWQSLRLMATKR